MTPRSDRPAPEAGSGLLFAREIIGIVLALVAALLLLALASAGQSSNWIGAVGAAAAFHLTFVLGRYVAFAVPVMLGAAAVHLILGHERREQRASGWWRALGGVMLAISGCAVLTLGAPTEGDDAAQRAFELGGTVGAWLVSDRGGLGLGNLLGRIGATLLFSGLALIGLVLFTGTLLRDLVRHGGGRVRGLWLAARRRGWPIRVRRWASERLPAALVGLVVGPWRAGRRFVAWLRQVSPEQRPRSTRLLPAGAAIIELTPADPAATSVARRALEPPEGARRGSSVLPRCRRETPAESQGGEKAAADPPGDHAIAVEKPGGPVFAPGAWQPEREPPAAQAELDLFPKEYRLPPLDLLADPPDTFYVMSQAEQEQMSQRIEQTLAQFKIDVKVVEVMQGPVITRFALKVAPGVRVSRILSLDSELAMALKAQHVRILAPIPGQAAVGVEVPNKRANPVLLKELLTCEAFQKAKSTLAFALGKNIAGEPVICDLAQMPHLLIAGTTGSGKSVCLNAIIASLLYRNTPDRVKFVMIDPKRVELSIYQAIPHLLAPVVCETRRAASALAWCVEQMEARYRLLAEIGVRNIDAYNALLADTAHPSRKLMGHGRVRYLPHIVIIIDELADLMMVARNEVEEYVIRLAQMARAVGMHLVLATQRPSVNVITGIIKANFPSRIAFQVSSKVDSRTILDMNGAEALMGRGDMLYSPGGSKPFRIQGAFVSDTEVERLADFIRAQEKARYEKEDFEARPTPAERAKAQLQTGTGEAEAEDEDADEGEPLRGLPTAGLAGTVPLTPADMEMLSDEMLYDMALRLILESRKASVSYIQRRMKIGYARAGRIMDMLEKQGIVGPYQGSKPRELLVDPQEYLSRIGGN